jgi:putative spermidine/putrescine transport system ATP-binding protein
MQIEIKKIHERLGVTVIYVTHDQDEALAMSDRVAVFADGSLRQISDPSGLYERPDNAVVANFVGDNNCLEGVVQRPAGESYVVRLHDEMDCKVSSNAELKSGDKVRVFVRPERVLIDDQAADRPATSKAVVEAILYLGDHARISLRSDGGASLAAKILNGAGGLHLGVGDRVAFSWREEDARAFLSDDTVLTEAD